MAINLNIPAADTTSPAATSLAARGSFVHQFLNMGHEHIQSAPAENHLLDNAFGSMPHAFAPTDLVTGGGVFHGGG